MDRLFAELRLQVARDVQAACETAGGPFALREDRADLFVVTAPETRCVEFQLTGSRIEATERTEGHASRLAARAEYDADRGGCRLSVGAPDGPRRFELWEFSREALEDLFFPRAPGAALRPPERP